MNQTPLSDSERSKKIIDSYCPDEARGGAMINAKMLQEDITEALTAVRTEATEAEREKCAKIAEKYLFIDVDSRTPELNPIAIEIRKDSV